MWIELQIWNSCFKASNVKPCKEGPCPAIENQWSGRTCSSIESSWNWRLASGIPGGNRLSKRILASWEAAPVANQSLNWIME